MGVPVETQAASTAAVGTVAVEPDPAAALSGGKAASSPGGQPRDLVAEYLGNYRGPTQTDQNKAFAVLAEINKLPDAEKRHEMVRQITESISANPIGVGR